MKKRLVELDPRTLYPKYEIDRKRLVRETVELEKYLSDHDAKEDRLGLTSAIIPFCRKILNDEVKLPMDPRQRPLDVVRLLDQGEDVPAQLEELFARVLNSACGVRADSDNAISKDGKLWAWMEFE